MREFGGKVAVVTGGASGIGRAMAERFAQEGMKVVVADIEAEALDKTVTAMRNSGAEAFGVRCDVAQSGEVESLAEQAFTEFGAVHILCNNAGVVSGAAPSWRQTEADWQWVLGVNLWGVIHGIRTFVPRMIAQDTEGHIVNTSSLSGLLALPFAAPYHVSKFGVVALTEGLHYELILSRTKLRTSVLCPAWVFTNITTSARNRPARWGEGAAPVVDKDWEEAFKSRLHEGLRPEVVADRVFEAVRDEQLYIWTHPEYKPAVRMRHEDIVDGRNPDIRTMLGGFGKEAKKTE